MSKSVIIKRMSFLNFKGIRNLDIEFNGSLTTISARNGLGKTSIFDGFTWVLFGKNSKDQKKFGIKTWDKSGKAIPRIPHEVTITLLVNGEEVTLCRRYNEKWTKKRGQAEETFDGHEEERLYNDVPCSVREFDEKISNLCSEEVFKFITNPLYFPKQKPEVQRAMLFRMAGGVSDMEIATGNKEFESLLSKLTGKNIEEYKREIQAKKRRIKNEVEMIPSRIDERKRDMPKEEDWVALNAELESKKQSLSEIENQLLDLSKSAEASSKERAEIARQLGEVKSQKSELQFKLKEQLLSDYRKQQSARNQLMEAISAEERAISTLQRSIQECDTELERLAKRREQLLAEWKQINEEQLTYNEEEFICPTCKRRFEVSEIEHRQQEISDNFLRNKAARLERNKQAGLDIKSKREEVEAIRKEAENNLAAKQLWSVKSGRAIGKSRVAVELNREINKINLSIHTHYRDILKRTGKVTAIEIKNAFQGIATAQKTLLVLFGEMMEDFKGRIGIDRAQSTYKQYEVLNKQLKQFLREEYHVEDIPLTELDLPFIEALNFFFRVKRKMKPRTVKARIVLLNKVIHLALHRRIITRPPFDGFELEKTELKNKSLTNGELDLLMKTPLNQVHNGLFVICFCFRPLPAWLMQTCINSLGKILLTKMMVACGNLSFRFWN